MHRALLRVLPGTRRSFLTSPCWCLESSSSSSTPYSLPQDAFSTSQPTSTSIDSSAPYSRSRAPLASVPASSPTSSSTPSAAPRRSRQKQFLTDSEAQAFADLLGEILPKSKASTSTTGGRGVFDLFGPPSSTTTTDGSSHEAGGIGKIQSALEKKLEKQKRTLSLRRGEREGVVIAGRAQLDQSELLELDRLREAIDSQPNDLSLYRWSLENVFGVPLSSTSGGLFTDGVELKIKPRDSMYPELLHHLFVNLRDSHRSPHLALKVFNLASSNAHSYILGCTSRLYLEVLKTRWVEGQGDLEGVLSGFEEMQSGGVRVGGTEEEAFKELVKEIGESVRLDRERTELVVKDLQARGRLPEYLDEREMELEIDRRRYYGDKDQVKSWRRMERILEDHVERIERSRREQEEERWKREETRYLRDDENPSLPLSNRGRGDDNLASTFYEKPSLFSHRDSAPSPRTHLHSPNRRAGLSPFENVPKVEPGARWRERDAARGMPKRPSYANPSKIVRKSFTRDEKARFDDPHPLRSWKSR